MSAGWYRDPFTIDVDDPGYGRLRIYRDDGESVELVGGELGVVLARVTDNVLRPGRADQHLELDVLPWPLTAKETRELLPALQEAVLLAAAGTDRFERVYPDERSLPDLICVNCGHGSDYTPTLDATNPWCDEHGHTPFGTHHDSWERAESEYEWQRRRHERARR